MNLTARGKIYVSNTVGAFLILLLCILTAFMPVFRIEWKTETLGVTEEYCINYSIFQYVTNADVQVNYKNIEDLEDIGIEKGDVKKLLGKVDMKEMKKLMNGDKVTGSSYGVLIIIAVMMLAMYFFMVRPEKKLQSMLKSESGRKTLEERYKNMGKDLDTEIKIGEIFRKCEGGSVLVWFALLALISPMMILLLKPHDFKNYTGHINIFWIALPILLLFGIVAFCDVMKKSAEKELREYKILDEKTLYSMPRTGRTWDYIKLGAGIDDESLDVKK